MVPGSAFLGLTSGGNPAAPPSKGTVYGTLIEPAHFTLKGYILDTYRNLIDVAKPALPAYATTRSS